MDYLSPSLGDEGQMPSWNISLGFGVFQLLLLCLVLTMQRVGEVTIFLAKNLHFLVFHEARDD